MIRRSRSLRDHGADVKQTGEQFEASQKFLRWQDRAANRAFFAGPHLQFSKEAADLLLGSASSSRCRPRSSLADTRFISRSAFSADSR